MTSALLEPWLGVHPRSVSHPPLSSELLWVANPNPPGFVVDQFPGGSRQVDLGQFSSALRTAGLFDNRSIDLPGAIVGLPDGMHLLREFRSVVRKHFESAGLLEYDYPQLGPLGSIETFSEVFPADHRVLFVGRRADFERRKPLGVLAPTGEPIIYPHWHQMVRTANDLPIEMYRHTRFLRPWSRGRGGQGIFNSLEGADMFEFHGCYQREKSDAASQRLFKMLAELTRALSIPVYWSTRPPWSNHAEVSRATLGGDTPLPSGATLQIATLYDQADIFSRPYDITYAGANGDRYYTHHVVGALSRRLLHAHLFHGMQSGGAFQVHPMLSPVQVHLVVRATALDGLEAARSIASALVSHGVRTYIETAENRRDVTRALRHRARLVVPLVVILQGRRHSSDLARAVLRRGDDLSELQLQGRDFSMVSTELLVTAFSDVRRSWDSRMANYFQSRCCDAHSVDDARNILRERKVALCALQFHPRVGPPIAQWQQGEILGFVDSLEPHPCILTGRPCQTTALISPRA